MQRCVAHCLAVLSLSPDHYKPSGHLLNRQCRAVTLTAALVALLGVAVVPEAAAVLVRVVVQVADLLAAEVAVVVDKVATKFGVGWRPELALAIARREQLDFVEIVADDFFDSSHLPLALLEVVSRGVEVIPHCISLSLGGAEAVDRQTVRKLDRVASIAKSSQVSDHLTFVRAGGIDSGHLLPVAYTGDEVEILVENIIETKKELHVPLALENIANLFTWPGAEYSEAEFFAKVLRAADVRMLLDISNLYANSQNHNFDPVEYLKALPLDRLSYVHVAGGTIKNGLYHDTHAHSIPEGALDLLRELAKLTVIPAVMLERDGNFPREDELYAELDAIREAVLATSAINQFADDFSHAVPCGSEPSLSAYQTVSK